MKKYKVGKLANNPVYRIEEAMNPIISSIRYGLSLLHFHLKFRKCGFVFG